MIRPFTCICFLMACGSGLYLYQAKHRVNVIDREIEKTVRATEDLREQTRVLHAEWTLQNDPQRLQALADQFLTLKTVSPGQFTSMADLDSRMPAVPPPEPPPSEQQQIPVAETPEPEEAPVAAAPAPPAPVPSAPKPHPAVAAVAPPPKQVDAPQPPKPVEHKPPPRPVIAEAQHASPTPVAARTTVGAEQPRRIIAASSPAPMPAPIVGSALGMAHNTSVPPPRPMPVSASQWVSNGGGG